MESVGVVVESMRVVLPSVPSPPMSQEFSSADLLERLETDRAIELRDVELLALVSNGKWTDRRALGWAERLLAHYGDVRTLASASPVELRSVRDWTARRAARLLAALELGRRAATRAWRTGEPFVSSRQVHAHFQARLGADAREQFFALLLDARHRLLAEHHISTGSLTASLVHPREVFRAAVARAAHAIICVHNHPSGDPSPSADDLEITDRLHQAGRTLGIELLDHVIVGDGGYTSLLDRGLPPFRKP
ncbi:MAG: DNA repair protein RadC [Planctomycetota bacterium]